LDLRRKFRHMTELFSLDLSFVSFPAYSPDIVCRRSGASG
jgi:hypothetical protein